MQVFFSRLFPRCFWKLFCDGNQFPLWYLSFCWSKTKSKTEEKREKDRKQWLLWIFKSLAAPHLVVLVADHKLDIHKQNVFAFAAVAASAEAAPARSPALDGMWIGNESCFEADKSLSLRPPPSHEIHQSEEVKAGCWVVTMGANTTVGGEWEKKRDRKRERNKNKDRGYAEPSCFSLGSQQGFINLAKHKALVPHKRKRWSEKNWGTQESTQHEAFSHKRKQVVLCTILKNPSHNVTPKEECQWECAHWHWHW